MNPTPKAFVLPALIAVLAIAVADPAVAENDVDLMDLSLEQLTEVDVVYGASRFLQKVSEAPSSISIVSADEIQRFGYRTLGDVLRGARGFHVSYDRNYTYVGVRGFGPPGDYNTRILLLVDGHRMNDNIYDMVLVGTEGILDLDIVERVEIIRGPSSSLYGANAFFAVVNVITRNGAGDEGFESSLGAGSYGHMSGRIGFGRRLGERFHVLASARGFGAHGQDLYFPAFNDPTTNDGIAEGNDRDGSKSMFASLRSERWSVNLGWGSRTKRVPTAAFGTVFNDPHSRTRDERGYVDLSYQRPIGEASELTLHGYYDRYDYRGTYPYDYPPLLLQGDGAQGAWWGSEARVSSRLGSRHTTTLGAELRASLRERQFTEDPVEPDLDDDDPSQNWSLFVQDEIRASRRWTVNGGLRVDSYRSFGSTWNPRLALIFQPQPQTSLKLLAGRAFRPPNAYERRYYDGNRAVDDLEPETIDTAEFVVERYFPGSLRLTGSLFSNEVEQLIVLTTDPDSGELRFVNAGRAHAVGLEMGAEKSWTGGTKAGVSFTWVHADDQASDALPNSPTQLAKLHVAVPVVRRFGGVFAGVEVLHLGERLSARRVPIDGHTLANLTLSRRAPRGGVGFSLKVENLFDADYSDPGSEEHIPDGIPQDGRSVRAEASFRF